ncbi:MAG: hypothetical protein BA870_01885 [Desulfuromonadales bacterium C00003094]|jgi:hypothetical protein|nr:MAG: hypothetical protein BA870_01885 [Desulfuromonadales bacterium C00003094]OEU72852.1 MAG: hypothetical protein BA869_11885 [Desulfuromonadales bacterium C00003107]
MNPLIPLPDPIPVSSGYLLALLLLVFPLHLLFMNCLLGTTAVTLYLQRRSDAVANQLAIELSRALPLVMAFVVNSGVASLLFLQVLYGQFFYTSSILMGSYWLAIIPLLIVAYYALYWVDFRYRRLGRQRWLLLSGVLFVLLLVPFLFSNNMTLMLHPQRWSAYFSQDNGTLLNLTDITLWPRYAHFIVAALAVGGLFTATLGRCYRSRAPELAAYARNLGMTLFSRLTLLQLLIGPLFLFSLPQPLRWQILGGSPLATLLITAALVLVTALLVNAFQQRVLTSLALLVPLVCCMVSLRAWLRSAFLQPHFTLDQLQVSPQYSPLLIFLIVLLFGSSVIGWLIYQATKAARQSS